MIKINNRKRNVTVRRHMNADEFEEFLTGKLDELEKDPRWITPEVINTVRKRLKERRKKGGLPSGRIE